MIRNLQILSFTSLLIGSIATASAGINDVIPKPQIVKESAANAKPFRATKLRVEGLYLKEEMRELLNEYQLTEDPTSKYTIRTVIVPSLPHIWYNKEEAYRLVVSEREIRVEALERLGLYRGLQTVGQLLAFAPEPGVLEPTEVYDWPAFRTRGLMHDVGRTYIPLSELKKQLILLSRYKVNVFHWHLTENQAWRLESKKYPQLNSAQSMTRQPGMYYTLDEARELVQFCKKLRITLIPEIDMPGHSAAFERAMGFGMQTPEGKAVLKDILREVAETMDVPYIHIGTDEVEFTDPTFVPEMVAYTRSLGKKVISWNPGWNYKVGEIDMTQLWSYRGKAQRGIPAIDCRLHYINHYDTYVDLALLWGSRIYNVDASNTNIAGSILAVWNDRFVPDAKDIMAQNNVYPSMLALAERAWRGGGWGYFDKPTNPLISDAKEELRRGFVDFEHRLLKQKDRFFAGEPFPYFKQTDAQWYLSEVYDNQGDLSMSYPLEANYLSLAKANSFTPPSKIEDTPFKTTFSGNGAYLRHVWGPQTCHGMVDNPKENSTAYVTAWVQLDKAEDAGLFIETQNYSRSESDLAPKQGTWDYKQSRVWLNGVEINPPTWTATHDKRDNEIPLGNENATARPVIPIKLNAGWNQILIKLPIGKFSIPEVRLNKWMFNAVITTPDGKAVLPLKWYKAESLNASTK